MNQLNIYSATQCILLLSSLLHASLTAFAYLKLLLIRSRRVLCFNIFVSFRSLLLLLFVNLRILTLSKINKFQDCCLMYKVSNNLLPSCFCLRLSLTSCRAYIAVNNCRNVMLEQIVYTL